MGFELAEEACEITDNGDPFLSYSWHLANCGQSVFAKNVGAKGVDLNLKKTWAQGIYGQGVKIRVSDDGLQDGHEDLTGNFSYSSNSRDYSISSSGPWNSLTAPPKSTSDNHGTSVAGLIAAVGWN
ncbi:MAG: S8 family serine peptidase, partial [Bdellovibrio sp.]|nr:S8 family serine peptidase [Bdellovibrio sp.]